jgi:hypothetical protein
VSLIVQTQSQKNCLTIRCEGLKILLILVNKHHNHVSELTSIYSNVLSLGLFPSVECGYALAPSSIEKLQQNELWNFEDPISKKDIAPLLPIGGNTEISISLPKKLIC